MSGLSVRRSGDRWPWWSSRIGSQSELRACSAGHYGGFPEPDAPTRPCGQKRRL